MKNKMNKGILLCALLLIFATPLMAQQKRVLLPKRTAPSTTQTETMAPTATQDVSLDKMSLAQKRALLAQEQKDEPAKAPSTNRALKINTPSKDTDKKTQEDSKKKAPQKEDYQELFYVSFLREMYGQMTLSMEKAGFTEKQISDYVAEVAKKVNDQELVEMTWPCLEKAKFLETMTTEDDKKANFPKEKMVQCIKPWLDKFEKDIEPINQKYKALLK